MRMIRRIRECEQFPPFYGLAWWDILRNQAICLPYPFNYIAGWGRHLWLKLRYAHSPDARKLVYQEGFHKGWTEGKRIGYEEGKKDTLVEMIRALLPWK